MKEKRKVLKAADCAIAAGFLMWASSGLAALPSIQALRDTAQTLISRYPTDTWRDTAQADQALTDITQARTRIEWMAYDMEVACQRRFFVNRCLHEVQIAMRDALHALRELEVDAAQYKRAERDRQTEAERQRKIAEAEREAAALSADFEQRRQAFAERQAQAEREQAERDHQAAERTQAAERENARRMARQAEQEAQRRREADAAQQRAANVKAYEEKQREARDRQQQIERRREEKK